MRIGTPLLLIICGVIDSTQTFAKLVHYSHRITGQPLFKFFGHEVFNPVYFFFGISKFIFNKKIQPLYIKAALHFAVWCIISLIIAVGWSWIHELLAKYFWNIHGTARFANRRDLKRNGMLKDNGVVIGQLNDAIVEGNKEQDGSISLKQIKTSELVCHPGKLSTLLIAPTGSGKGVSVLIPTLLSYRGSMVVLDTKGENYSITSGWRRTFSRILKFAPCSYDTIRFNPVLAIRDGDEYSFRDANLIADVIFSPEKAEGGMNESEAYFSNSAKDIVTAALMHIRFSDYEDKSLAGLLKFLTQTNYATLRDSKGEANSEQGKEQCLGMIDAKHYYTITQQMYQNRQEYYVNMNLKVGDRIEATKLHDLIVEGATRALNKNAKERSSVFATVFTKLQLFDDPVLAAATSGTDFEIEDFITCDEPITLYLTVPYSDIKRISPVFRLLISFMLKKFSEGETQYGQIKLKHNILFLLDEFPILGTFPDIAEVMGVLRGYGIFFLIVCQALNQLVARYGQNHPFLDHCPVQVVFAPGSIQDAELFSKSIGQESVHQEKVSRSGQRLSNIGSLQFSDNDMGRALLDAADIKRLPPDKALITVHGMQPYIAEKVVYYMDKRFTDKLKLKAPESMKELFKEISGLPSRKRIKAEIENRKRYWATVTYTDISDNEVFAFDDEDIYDKPIESDIIKKLKSLAEQKKQIQLISDAMKIGEEVVNTDNKNPSEEAVNWADGDTIEKEIPLPTNFPINNLQDDDDNGEPNFNDFGN